MWLTILIILLSVYIFKWFNRSNKLIPKNNQVVFITGCDSGLGYFSAVECHKKGFTVIATVLDKDSKGAQLLQQCSVNSSVNKIHLIEMNLLNEDTIVQAYEYLLNLLENGFVLHAVVNNAGVMCFGDFEWFVKEMIMEQLKVNLVGPMLIVKQLLPAIRKHKARIVNVISHCSFNALPGVSVYSASKAGLKLWSDAIRKELKKFDVKVINFIPGSFFQSSNIATRTVAYVSKMKEEMTSEQLNLYEDYFERYYGYIKHAFNFKSPAKVTVDKEIVGSLIDTLVDVNPKATYKMEPWKYKFYYTAINIIPGGSTIDHWLTEKFMSLPKYKE